MIKDYWRILKKQLPILVPITVAVILYSLFFSSIFKGHSACMFKEVLGTPCMTCGVTRAFKAFFRLDFKEAFYFHPLFWLIPIILWIVIFKERPLINKIFNSKIFWIVIILVFIITYVLRLIYIYPEEPMSPSIPFWYRWFN